jgi:hypothetical protein
MPDELITVLSQTDSSSEISFRKRISEDVLNYVLDRLRAYSVTTS